MLLSRRMPDRWRKVHDCERPTKWRQSMDDDDCELYELELASGRPTGQWSQGTVAAVWKRLGRPAWRRKYTEVVPQLTTMEELLDRAAKAAAHDRLLIVKAYSNRCRACVRIAAKYRRLALKYHDEIDCYELEESAAAGELLQRLGVKSLPWLLVFDGEAATQLASCACKVADFKGVEVKVLSAVEAMKKRRSLLRKLVAKNPNLVRLRPRHALTVTPEPTFRLRL
jgi:hypothetical protein